MRKLILIACVIFLSQLLAAQQESVAIHAVGKAFYYAPQQNKAQTIYPGMRLSLEGRVRVAGGGSIKLLYQGETFTISEGKAFLLRDLEHLSKGSAGLGFFSRFWSFLSRSVEQSKDEKALEENHRRYMEAAHAAVKGFAQQEYAIRTSFLFSGKMSAAPVVFKWSGMPGEGHFRFVLNAQADRSVLVSALVRDSSLSINLMQLALIPGQEYAWQILPADDTLSVPSSSKNIFLYDPPAAAQILEDLLPYHEYQHSTPAEQLLIQAYALENAGFYYEAYRKYAAAATAEKHNLLVRDARAAFLARMDLLEEAKALVKQ
jgi:hypothetical protein